MLRMKTDMWAAKWGKGNFSGKDESERRTTMD
jgi:hypothetical protein